MAMTTTNQILHDGARNLVMQFTGTHDGSGGQESEVVKVDVSALSPPAEKVHIRYLEFTIEGGSVALLWGHALTAVPFLVLTGHNTFDYSRISGLPNGAGDGATGDILLSTTGFGNGSAYTLKIEMVKKP
jgi:hypothetical protein